MIRSLLRALEGGATSKELLDAVIDACAAMQNLREAIASYRNRIYYDTNDARRQSLLQVTAGNATALLPHPRHTPGAVDPCRGAHLWPRPARLLTWVQVCLEYLERYYFLIAFTAYLSGPSFDPGGADHTSFAEWWRHRPELRSVLERMLRRNPLAALSLDKSPDALAAGLWHAGAGCWCGLLGLWASVLCPEHRPW